jgi:Big-like domain-containing protein/invasin-like protein
LVVVAAVGVATCRLGDILGKPRGGVLVVSPFLPDTLKATSAVGSAAKRTALIDVSNAGDGDLAWSAIIKHNSSWVALNTDTGTAGHPPPLQAIFDPKGLPVGEYEDTVIVSANGGAASIEVPLWYQVHVCDTTALSLDDSVSSTLTSADCGAPHRAGRFGKVYRFQGILNDSVSVELSGDFDAYVAVDSSLASNRLPLNQSDDCLGAAPNPCLYYNRLPFNGTFYVEVTSADSADTGSFKLRLVHPRLPPPPTALDQRLNDSVTAIASGATVNATSVLFRATVNDPDLGDSLHLEAEVRPINQPLTQSSNVPNGPTVANGGTAWVSSSGLSDKTSYHWEVRARDNTGRSSGWDSLPGNTDFTINIPHAPNLPTALAQAKPDNTPINPGGTADTDVVVFSASVSDQDLPQDQLRLQVEVEQVLVGFTNTPTDSSPPVAGGIAQVSIQNGNNKNYHWQARVTDLLGQTSNWVSFGNNSEGSTDFRIQVANLPDAPTALAQFQSNGTTALPVGGVTASNFVVLKGVVTDPDVGQTVELDVEVRPVGIDFTNQPMYFGSQVAIGATSSVTVGPLANNTNYHWQAQAKDNTGRSGAWVSFPISPPNAETVADFSVQQPPTQLQFTVNPSTTGAGSVIVPAVQVTAKDINGQVSTGFTDTVTISIDPANNPGGGTLFGTLKVAAVAGVATFSDLRINKAGINYKLQAVTSALNTTSNPFTVNPGPTAQLVFTTNPPLSTQSGATMTPAVKVTAMDTNLNVTPLFTGQVTLAITANTGTAGAVLTGGSPTAAVAGVATFAGLSVDKVGSGYTLDATSGTLKRDTSMAFGITAGPPTHLFYTVQPTQAPTASPITPAITVRALDLNNNQATSFTGNVTLTITAGTGAAGAVLSNGGPVAAVNGDATFPNASIDKIGTNYQLDANATGLVKATSDTFRIINSPISSTLSTVSANPTAIMASSGSLTSTITVTALDGAGQPVQGATVVLSASPSAGVTVTQPSTTTNASGVTTGTISSDSAGAKVVTAVISGVTIAQTPTVTVNPAAASVLVFTAQPGTTTAGAAITSGGGGVVVTARDPFGNTATSFNSSVNMGVATGPGTLTGTTVATAASGIATFNNLRLRVAGSYTLQATATGLTSATSASFSVLTGPTNLLLFTRQPGTTAAFARIDSAAGGVVVTAFDSTGLNVTNFTGNVRVGITSGTGTPGAVLGGVLQKAAVAGVATFTDLTIDKLGTGYTLTTTATGLISDESTPFDIIPGPATKLVFTNQPTDAIAGARIDSTTNGVVVTAQDAHNFTATSFSGNVAMAIGTNPPPGTGILTGGGAIPAVSGVATFPNLRIDKANTGYTLAATSAGLTQGTSALFNILPGGASASQSTVSASPGSIAASSGATTSTITVTAKDASGNPIAGATVVLAATGSSNNLVQPGSTTNASGVTTGTLSSTVAESKTVSATITVGANPPVPVTQTATVTVTPATATVLVFTKQPPASVTAGAAITPAVQVEVRDAFANKVTSPATTVTLNVLQAGRGTLSLNSQLTSAGTATFTGMNIDKATTGLTPDSLIASATSLTSDTSTGFAVVPAAATKLAFVQQPTSTTGGATITPAVTVEVEDAFGNRVTSASTSITLAIGTNPSNGNLNGPRTQAASAGLATFSNLNIDSAGPGYTLNATAVSLTGAGSAAFNITVGAASKLAFHVQPNDAAGGATISPPVQIEIQDAGGNRVTSASNSIAIAIANNAGPGGKLSGTSPVSAVNGIATFSDLSIDKIGTGYTLSASTAGLAGATSAPFDITGGTATKLAFIVQPGNAAGGATISPAVQVEVEDAGGNRVTSATNSISLAFGTNAGPGAALSGTNPVSAVAGVATFSNLSVDSAGNGYTLVASTAGLTGATSNPFNINVGAASKLGFLAQPSNATGGATITPAVQVEVRDAGGNRVTSATNNISLAIGVNAGPNAVLTGGGGINAVSGVATFSGLSIDSAGAGYTLVASASGLSGATSTTFNITVGAATKLGFLVQPTPTTGGTAIAPAVQIEVRDAGGNRVTSATNNISLAIGVNAGPNAVLTGGGGINAVSGVATFSGLSIDSAGTGYTLIASTSGLTGATSTAFNVTVGSAVKLAFHVEPSSATAGVSIAPQIQVEIQDAGGNRVSTNNTVAIAIANDPPGGTTLFGTTSKNATNGLASFNNLSIQVAASGFTLQAASGALTAATSTSFNITPAAADHLVFTVQPSDGTAGNAITPAVVVTVQDQFGNTANFNGTVTLTVVGGGSGITGNSVAASSGVATFSNLILDTSGTYNLNVDAGALPTVQSSSFTIT